MAQRSVEILINIALHILLYILINSFIIEQHLMAAALRNPEI